MKSPISNLLALEFAALPPQMQVAARWIADHPADVALLSMREQARRAGVPLPTLSRLAIRLKFKGFEALKAVHAGQMREQHGSFRGSAENLLKRRRAQKDDDFVADHMTLLAAHLTSLTAKDAVASLVAAANRIAAARRTFCLGLRSSFAPAFMFHYIHSLFGADSVLLDGAGGTGVDALRTMGKEDVLLAVSIEPYTRQTLHAVEFAAERKIGIIALTDSCLSPIARLAATSIIIATGSPSFFHAMTPALAAVECLAALVAQRRGKPSLAAISRSDQQLAAFDAFVAPRAKKGHRRR